MVPVAGGNSTAIELCEAAVHETGEAGHEAGLHEAGYEAGLHGEARQEAGLHCEASHETGLSEAVRL